MGFRAVVLPRTFRPETDDHRAAADAAASVLRVSAVVLVPVVVLRLVFQLQLFRDPFAPVLEDLSILVFQTSWGDAWLAQVLGVALLVIGASRRGRAPWAWWLSGVAALGLGLTPAFSGHALGSERLTALAVAADGVHVVAAGVWIGGLGTMLLAGRRGARLPGLVRAFSPVALTCGALIVTTGVFASWLHLPSFGAIWTPYGRLLLLKVGLVGLVFALGALNWKRFGPAASKPGGAGRLSRAGSTEFLVAQAVLLVTAFFVATTPPMS